jgi:hypothetical protein
MSEIKTAMKIVAVDIDKLIPYDRNIKKHPKEQVEKIVASIKAAGGWDQPIVVDKNYVIIKGHGRRLAALQMGMKKVPVLMRDDMTEDQVKAARMADNRASISDIDTELFRLELSTMSDELDFSMADLGAMNSDVFIDNLDAAVSAQKNETDAKIAAIKEERVVLKKAFGFDSIAMKDELYVSRFMAQIEAQSGLKGELALMHFIKALVTDGSQ